MSWVLRILIGVALGGGIGYGLSRLLCTAGGCPITSNRPLMVVLGAFLGVWLVLSGCSKQPSPKQAAPAQEVGKAIATPEEFAAQVVGPGKPALVDFYADWCPPCRKLKPVLKELEGEYAGKVAFFRVDVDTAEQLARAHNVRNVPTLLLYRSGNKVGVLGPPFTAESLRKGLDGLLAGP